MRLIFITALALIAWMGSLAAADGHLNAAIGPFDLDAAKQAMQKAN